MELNINSTIRLNNGVEIPLLGLGTWQIKGKDVINSIHWALEAGYRHIDTAKLYGNEKEIGQAIKESGVSRDDIFITTKVWDSDQGFEKTINAFNSSLKRLDLSYVDLYLIHWPRNQRNETWKALEKIYDEDKTRAIGVSNFAIHHLKELLENAEIIPAVNQIEFSPFLYQKELLEYCKSHDIAVEAYSPLTHGKKLGYIKLISMANKYIKSVAQILIRWSLQHDLVVLPKSKSRAHIYENTKVFDFNISDEDMDILDNFEEYFRLLYDTSKWD